MQNWKDQFTVIEGVSIRYRETGKGPLLFLVHGIVGFLEEWNLAAEILLKKYHIIALDLPGHGLSGKPEIPYTIDQLTGFLRRFILSFSPDRVFLAGHSLGGAICLNLIIQTPHMVERLILVNSAFDKIPFTMRLGRLPFLSRMIKRIPLWMVKLSSRRSIFKKERVTPQWNKLAYRYINTPDNLRVMFSIIRSNITLSGLDKNLLFTFKKGLKKVNIPVLILYGTKDRVLPNSNSKALHQQLKNSKCTAIENCSHELQYESHEAFCEAVQNFLF